VAGIQLPGIERIEEAFSELLELLLVHGRSPCVTIIPSVPQVLCFVSRGALTPVPEEVHNEQMDS
jgi:hypothetical protein